MAEPKIRIRGLRKAFGAHEVLTGVDLDIEAGSNLVLFGGSASGKTVLTKCILGLMTPDAGSIMIDGVETARLTGRAREAVLAKFGVLFQNGALFDSLSIWRNITFALVRKGGMPEDKAREIARHALTSVGLTPDTADLLPSELSGGMQKRVALARAIASRPEILILDCPTDGLDPIVTTHIGDLIVRVRAELKATTLTITHDIASARRIGDRAAFLHHGKITWAGPMAEIDRSGDAKFLRYLSRETASAFTA